MWRSLLVNSIKMRAGVDFYLNTKGIMKKAIKKTVNVLKKLLPPS
ncbi:hypothetical protein [Metallosphaera tengchongensis]|nr:hypothetical protein [Metallosphaera tengchongensis]